MHINEEQFQAASRVIYNELRRPSEPDYDTMSATDPIGLSEFGGIMERAFRAAGIEPPPPPQEGAHS
jgi:hypothetical protein